VTTTNGTRIYRIDAPEALTFYSPDLRLWFCSGVGYAVALTGRVPDGFRCLEVGGNHDAVTDVVPLWYQAACGTLALVGAQGQVIPDPVPDPDGGTLRIVGPHVATYCDGPAEPPAATHFIEGVTYVSIGHPRAAYYSGHGQYTTGRVDQAPVWWGAAVAGLQQMHGVPLAPPTPDAAGASFVRA
jgi:hypothetical protein